MLKIKIYNDTEYLIDSSYTINISELGDSIYLNYYDDKDDFNILFSDDIKYMEYDNKIYEINNKYDLFNAYNKIIVYFTLDNV